MTAVEVRNIVGRAWVFSQDYVNTDAIMPRRGYDLAPEAQEELVLATLRPGATEPSDPTLLAKIHASSC